MGWHPMFPPLLLSSLLGLLQGTRGDLPPSLPTASSPVGLSAFVTLFLSLFLRGLPSPFLFFSTLHFLLLLLLVSSHSRPPPPIPHGLAAVLNAQKRGALTYITSAAQLMSWSISAV